jgi:hypothetical protein
MEVGKRYLCIHTFKFNPEEPDLIRPVKGRVYTARDVNIDIDPPLLSCRLEEIVNPPKRYREGYMEAAFNQNKFVEINESPELSEVTIEDIIYCISE